MTRKLSLRDLSLKGKKVLMRVDFNVPLDKNANITDDTRIKASLPSIRYVLDQGGSLILMSHLGRPKDKVVPELSLEPCAKRLSQLINQEVLFVKDCVGPEVEDLARNLKPGQLLLLENLRFHKAEEYPDVDPDFSKRLASLGDLYVNDAFGTAHRSHSSTADISKYFPESAAAGFLMEKELEFLGSALREPKRPFYAVIGGAKISSKIGVLQALIAKADAIFVGGGMAYTFLKSAGISIGDSIHEEALMPQAKAIMDECVAKGVKLFLPVDHVVAEKATADSQTQVVDNHTGIPDGTQGLDIGPKTVRLFVEELQKAKTVFWNGPLGVFEVEPFDRGTHAIAAALANLDATTIVGGGDSIAALQKAELADKVTHLSTGGGASLEFIEQGSLPGIDALSNKR